MHDRVEYADRIMGKGPIHWIGRERPTNWIGAEPHHKETNVPRKVRPHTAQDSEDFFADDDPKDYEDLVWTEGSEPRVLLRKDLRQAARSLTIREIRYFVDLYYQWQDFRIATGNQRDALEKAGEPNFTIGWAESRIAEFEKDVHAMMDAWTKAEPTGMGMWARDIVGIGPVISAGLCSNIDISKCPTAGHVWRFAGLDPKDEWIGRKAAEKLVHEVLPNHRGEVTYEETARVASTANQKPEEIWGRSLDKHERRSIQGLIAALARRPWSASLKVLSWKIGDSFVKQSNHPKDYYGKLYVNRKMLEIERNNAGLLAEQAAEKLRRFDIGRSTVAYSFYSKGLLPPAHIQARARRYAVKIFLCHWHQEAYARHFQKEPPVPYPIAYLGHVGRLQRPNPTIIDPEAHRYPVLPPTVTRKSDHDPAPTAPPEPPLESGQDWVMA